MFSVTRTYKVSHQHMRGGVSLSYDVSLDDAAFRDRKALGKALRSAGVLLPGARVTAFRGEAGGRIEVTPATPGLSTLSLPIFLDCIPCDMPHARLAMGKAEPGQRIELDDCIIETTLHRLG